MSISLQPDAQQGQASPAAPAPGRTGVRSRLFTKYVALFVAVVGVALLSNGVFEVFFYYREHKASLIRIQHEQAEAAAAKIGQFIKEIESQLGWTTQLPWSAGTIEQRRFDALRLLRQVPGHHRAGAGRRHRQGAAARLTPRHGRRRQRHRPLRATRSSPRPSPHKVYYGPVYFRRESEPYMTLALAGTRRDAGVSIAEVNLKLIWDVVSQIKVGESGRAYVVDAQGRLIAHPDISLVLRNTECRSSRRCRPPAGGAATESALQGAKNIEGQEVLTAYAPIAPLGWLVFVELPVEEAYAPLYRGDAAARLVLLGGADLRRVGRDISGPAHGGADPGLASRRGAHRRRRSSASASRSRPATNSRALPISSTTWPEGCRNPTPTWKKRSNSAPPN